MLNFVAGRQWAFAQAAQAHALVLDAAALPRSGEVRKSGMGGAYPSDFNGTATIDFSQGPSYWQDDDLPDIDAVEVLKLFVDRRTDLRAMPHMLRLRELSLSGVPKWMPESDLPALEKYDGPMFGAVERAPMLREWLCIEGRSPMSHSTKLCGPVARIRVNGDGSKATLPQFSQPEVLREFTAYNYEAIDLTGLSAFQYLNGLYLSSIGRLAAAEEIGALRRLEVISLERVLEVVPIEATLAWRASNVIAVADKHAIAPQLRDALLSGEAPWSIPRAASLYVGAPTPTTTHSPGVPRTAS